MSDINKGDIPYAFRTQKPKPSKVPQGLPIQTFKELEEMGFKINPSNIIPTPTKEDKLRGHLSGMDCILNHEIEGYMEDFCCDIDMIRTDYSDLVDEENLQRLRKASRRVWKELAVMHIIFDRIYDKYRR